MKIKKWLKKTILVLILTLSLLIIPLFSSAEVKADGSSQVTINNNTNYEELTLNNLDFNRDYFNVTFLNNNFGLSSRGINLEDMLFWGPIKNNFETKWDKDYLLIGCELVITINYQGVNYTFTTGFSYSENSGFYNQYVSNDVACVLGTQLVDFRTGLKTYTALKNEAIISFNIAAVELYYRLQKRTSSQPELINYHYWNSTTNTILDNTDAMFIFNSISELKQCKLIALNGSSQDIYDKGYDNGYIVGEEDGYEDGYDVGTTDGKKQGYEVGYSTGKIDGYEEGYTASGYGIDTMTGSILASFFGAFWTIASFEIFGIKLWTIPAIIGGVGLIWIVIKFFLGKGD